MAKKPTTTAKPTKGSNAQQAADKKRTSGKRKVVKKVQYTPATDATWQPVDEEGNPVGEPIALVDENGKYTNVPADYDPAKHKPLKRNEFADESMWFELAATVLEAKAARLRVKATESKKLGGGKDRAKAKKLLAMQKRFDELKKSLAESGLNVDEILASMATDAGDEDDTEGGEE